jgi:hypothetical protein
VSSSKRLLRAGFLLIVILAIAMMGIGFAASDGSPANWILLKIYNANPIYYDVNVELRVSGERIRVTRIMECKPRLTRTGLFSFYPSWYPARHLISERLPSGGGILIVPPRICLDQEPVAGNYWPLVMLVDSVDNPSVIRAFYDEAGSDGGDATVAIERVTVSFPTQEHPLAYETEFSDWVPGWVREPLSQGESQPLFYAAVLFEVPDALWRQSSDITSRLLANQTFGVIDSSSDLVTFLDSVFSFGVNDRPFIDQGFYPTKRYPSPVPADGKFRFRMRDALPLRPAGDALEPANEAKGVVLFFKSEVMNQYLSGRGGAPGPVRLNPGQIWGDRGAGSYVWIPSEQHLYLMRSIPMRLILQPR